MSKTLATAVHLTEEGIVHTFLPGSTPPKWAADRITNPNAWSAEEESPAPLHEAPAVTTHGVPPRSGKGSGIQAWRAYADANGFETDDDIGRDEIIAALKADGIPTE